MNTIGYEPRFIFGYLSDQREFAEVRLSFKDCGMVRIMAVIRMLEPVVIDGASEAECLRPVDDLVDTFVDVDAIGLHRMALSHRLGKEHLVLLKDCALSILSGIRTRERHCPDLKKRIIDDVIAFSNEAILYFKRLDSGICVQPNEVNMGLPTFWTKQCAIPEFLTPYEGMKIIKDISFCQGGTFYRSVIYRFLNDQDGVPGLYALKGDATFNRSMYIDWLNHTRGVLYRTKDGKQFKWMAVLKDDAPGGAGLIHGDLYDVIGYSDGSFMAITNTMQDSELSVMKNDMDLVCVVV